MFLSGLGTATPSTRWTQMQCWDALVASDYLPTLNPRSQAILRKVLRGNNGICSRHLAFDHLSEAFDFDPDVLDARFAKHAPAVASQAAARALDAAGRRARRHRRGHHQHVHRISLSGPDELRHRAARPADRHSRARPRRTGLRRRASEHARRRSAHRGRARQTRAVDLRRDLQRGDVPGRRPGRAHQRVPVRRRRRRGRPHRRADARPPPHRMEVGGHADERRRSRRASVRAAPRHAAQHPDDRRSRRWPRNMSIRCSAKGSSATRLSREDITGWILHAGGREILAAIRQQVGLTEDDTRWSAAILRDYGNVSSPCVYFVLRGGARTSRRPAATGGCRRSAPASAATARCSRSSDRRPEGRHYVCKSRRHP